MTSTGINFRAYSWLPESVNTTYSTTTKYQVLTYPQARTISKKKKEDFDPSPRTIILPRLVGENSVLESEIYFSSFSVLVDAKS